MLCIVCSRPIPIPIYRDENKLCKSCASQIKLKNNLMKEVCTDVDLESVQRQLLRDLNLEEDSDYEAELNYLREAKKNLVLGKDKNLQSIHPTERFNEYPNDHFEKECMPENPNEVKKKDEQLRVLESFGGFKFGRKNSIENNQRLRQQCDCSQQVTEKTNRRVIINRDSMASIKKADENSNQSLDVKSLIACRAVFRPTHKHKEPCQQFEKILTTGKSGITKIESVPTTGNKNPFICPVTFCKNIIPVSDLIKHFKLNHIRVPIVPVNPGTCTNLFWEAKVDKFGTSQCLMLLLSSRKCTESGGGQFKDFLPVAIMTTKVKLTDLVEMDCSPDDRKHFYLIWLTAMSSSVEPVYYTITAWNGKDNGQVHIVNTTQSYSIRADQNPKIVYRSGMMMMLTSDQINRLSNNNQEMVKLQVVVH